MLMALQGAVLLQSDHDPQLAVEFGEESLDLAQASNSPETILQALQGLGHFRRHSRRPQRRQSSPFARPSSSKPT